jgi:hypothetical protein
MSKEALYTIQELSSIVDVLKKDHYGECQQFIEYIGEGMLDTIQDSMNAASLDQISSIEGQKALRRTLRKVSLGADDWAFQPMYMIYAPLYLVPLRDIPLLINRGEEPFVQAIYKWRLEVAGK